MISQFGSLVVIVVLIVGAYQCLEGRKVRLAPYLFHRIWAVIPALGIVIVLTILWVIAFYVQWSDSQLVRFDVIVAAALGLAFILLASFFWATLPASVLERRIFSSFRRSVVLSRGNRWRVPILALLLVASARLIHWGASYGAFQLTFLVESFLPVPIIDWVVSAIVTAFSAVVVAVSYYRLRAAKDGMSESRVSEVFR